MDNRHSLPIYMACSVLAAGIEYVLGWILLQLFPQALIATNTAAILASSVVHYALTTKFAFGAERNASNAAVYAVTFVLGLLLQNLILWVFYDLVLSGVVQIVRYGISKTLSLGIPFFLMYYIRKTLNEAIKKRKESQNV